MYFSRYRPSGQCPACKYPIDGGRCPECGKVWTAEECHTSERWFQKRWTWRTTVIIALGVAIGAGYYYRPLLIHVMPVPLVLMLDGTDCGVSELSARIERAAPLPEELKRWLESSLSVVSTRVTTGPPDIELGLQLHVGAVFAVARPRRPGLLIEISHCYDERGRDLVALAGEFEPVPLNCGRVDHAMELVIPIDDSVLGRSLDLRIEAVDLQHGSRRVYTWSRHIVVPETIADSNITP